MEKNTESIIFTNGITQDADKYNILINSIDECFYIIDIILDSAGKPIDWRYLEINPQYLKQRGSLDDVGQLVSVRYPETELFWYDFFGKVAISGITAHTEYEYKKLDKWFDISAYKIGGIESLKVAVLTRDITERKRLEQAMLSREKEYLEIIDSSSEGSFIHDIIRGEIYFSHEWQKRLCISHLSPSQTEKEMLSIVHPDDINGMQHAYESALLNHSPKVRIEFRVKIGSSFIWILGQAKIIY